MNGLGVLLEVVPSVKSRRAMLAAEWPYLFVYSPDVLFQVILRCKRKLTSWARVRSAIFVHHLFVLLEVLTVQEGRCIAHAALE
mmetsp:Transcript_7228/g.32066  ORF Transcript_7228/g.32066 Transcript_7228/m.32066 type:complete len:84 (+) Transcript_7228:1676-1927(+)